MRELTKAERHEVYKLALKDLAIYPFICIALKRAIRTLYNPNICGCDAVFNYGLIEFYAYKPLGVSIGDAWMISEQRRIEILTQCIAETAP